MAKYLYEYDTGSKFAPASLESVRKYEAAVASGQKYFLYPYHGYGLRMVVKDEIKNKG